MVQRAEAHRIGAAPLALIHQHAQARAQHGQRNAQLRRDSRPSWAASRRQCAAPRWRPVVPGPVSRCAARAPGRAPRWRTGTGAGPPAASVKATQIRSPKPAGSSTSSARGIPHHMRVANLDQQVRHALMHAGQRAPADAGRRRRCGGRARCAATHRRSRPERVRPAAARPAGHWVRAAQGPSPSGVRYSRSVRPCSEAAMVCAMACSDCCSPSRSAVSISRAYS